MGAWDAYEERISAHGGNRHDAKLLREQRRLRSMMPDDLTYFSITVYPQEYGYNITSEGAQEHSFTQDVSIIDSDTLTKKTLCTLPSEDIDLGSLIYWKDSYWLVTDRDQNTTVRTKVTMQQCNHLLKWIAADEQIIEQWCVFSDGTKYMSGENEDRNFVVTRGDTRVAIQIARNAYTLALDRESRFLIDDEDSPHKLSYILSKPLKLGYTYNSKGTFVFVLQEVTATEDDNHELGIADYYKHFPKQSDETDTSDEDTVTATEETERKVWI